MPICWVPPRAKDPRANDPPTKDMGQDKVQADPNPDWREPPGYLGEAVRRAKRMAQPKRDHEPNEQ